MGDEMPVTSMDSNGKITIIKNNVVSIANMRGLVAEDGAKLDVAPKELGPTELYATSIQVRSV
jgi:hypothetical protein